MVVVVKDQLLHFSHHHPLNLLHLQPPKHREDDDDDNDEDDFVEEDNHGGQCNLCNEQIWSFHSCYYHCESCDYSLHKFCAELPESTQDHPLHIGHTLTLSMSCPDKAINSQIVGPEWLCIVCNLEWESTYNYYCSICILGMDIICATLQHQTINHPSHPHQLERMSGHIISKCLACNNKHEGVFFQCATCRSLRFNLDCLLLPAKLLIQNYTHGSFIHSHPLSLAYSFPYSEYKDKSYPPCRVCDGDFYAHLWIYKCDKCLYYVHVDCATSQVEPFMSIFLLESRGKTSKNFKEDEHPNLLHCPFHDEGDNVLKHYMFDQKKFISSQHDGEMLNHFSHQHPLILTDKQTSVGEKLVSIHDPMKRVQLLCDGCVKPIMTVPFYICFQYADEKCCFVLHEWCAKLPIKIEEYDGHPQHTLFLLSKIPGEFSVYSNVPFASFHLTVSRMDVQCANIMLISTVRLYLKKSHMTPISSQK
ncbi:hypothetical protein E3N88_38381 [Mikania micrantha]|uniref:DC1 domain-containing protein n=1 Tax=Mikania micrantha TaxID=192012 RepID=A0A5N6LTV6_9ASTR|nr:hypothetical protein E3N88_38381 [Mikania micrantha]